MNFFEYLFSPKKIQDFKGIPEHIAEKSSTKET